MQTHRLVETIHSEDGTSPLGVMLANLTFYHNSAVALTEKLMLVADLLTPEKIAEGGEDGFGYREVDAGQGHEEFDPRVLVRVGGDL